MNIPSVAKLAALLARQPRPRRRATLRRRRVPSASALHSAVSGRAREPGDEPRDARRDGIAIVGMAGRFPGASSVDELWANLLAGRESITRFAAG